MMIPVIDGTDDHTVDKVKVGEIGGDADDAGTHGYMVNIQLANMYVGGEGRLGA